MFAYPRRLALGIASLAAPLLGLGLVALSATPAAATTCPSITFGTGPTLTNCSEIFTITGSPGSYQISPPALISNGSNLPNNGFTSSGDVLVGVINNTGSTVYDLYLQNTVGGSPIFGFAFHVGENLCSTTPSVCFPGGITKDEGFTSATVNYSMTGQEVSFIFTNSNNGDVVFGSSGIAPGGSAYFGLTAPANAVCVTNPSPSNSCITTASEPAAIGIFLAGLMGFGILRHRWLARAASPRRPRPTRQSRQIRPIGWISRLWATA